MFVQNNINMKRVFLARHGQTNANVTEMVQGEHEPLNNVGQRQAIKLAERVQHLPIDKMYVSDYLRTRQTAEPILDVLDVPVEYVADFREERPPTSWVNVVSEKSDEGQQFFINMVDKASDPDWRVEDAENAHDVLARIQSGLRLLEADPAENILVVSHGTYLKQFIANLLFDGQGAVADVAAFKRVFKTTNTGISMIQYDGVRWRVLTWNDHAHFAE